LTDIGHSKVFHAVTSLGKLFLFSYSVYFTTYIHLSKYTLQKIKPNLILLSISQPELSAGGIYIAAEPAADSGVYAAPAKFVSKQLSVATSGGRQGDLIYRIQQYQIHVTRQHGSLMKQCCQGARALRTVIFSVYKSVLKGNPTSRGVKIVSAGVEHLCYLILIVHRHQRAARLVI
jgi:hypothetical protein